MSFPQTLYIYSNRIPTLTVFLAVSILTFLYIFWYEGKKEGFDQEKLFDIAFASLLIFLLALRYELVVVMGMVIAGVYGLAHLWKWSTFRILDIFSLSVYASLVPVIFGFMMINRAWALSAPMIFIAMLYYHLMHLRNLKLKSGYVFSFLLLMGSLLGALYFRETKHLIFYTFLFMISMLNLYLRERKSVNKAKLPMDLLKSIQKKLLSKDNRLSAEQKMLIEADPYMTEGRDTDNAELMDDALLEDSRKEITDIRISALARMQAQVRRALARIKIGTYGECEVCGIPIDKARLQAYPEATTCLKHSSNAGD